MDITSYPRTPRLVNRFSLGADPEFVFTDKTGNYIHAENIGLNTLQAFGCDMAGRQAELRAYPSKFALEVVASMIDTLRWMSYAYNPTINTLNWSSIAWNGFDGCGGHIHFGRKRKDRMTDVFILDQTAQCLLGAGILDKQSQKNRLAKTKYGRYGDIRTQSHGYEYRTLPTAMANPWLAYFTLVINKLAVYKGVKPTGLQNYHEYLLGLLEQYKDVDDDAAIAWKAVRIYGFPVDSYADMKPYWGISMHPLRNDFNVNSLFFPSIIKPEEETCHELFMYLTKRISIPHRMPKPTWSPFLLPEKFSKVTVQVHTLGHLPDVGMNLIAKKVRVYVDVTEEPTILIKSGIALPVNKIKEALSTVYEQDRIRFLPCEGHIIHISVPGGFKNSLAQCKFLNKVLGNTELFPICKAKNFYSTDWSKWDANTSPLEVKPVLGKVISSRQGCKKEEKIPKKTLQSQVDLLKQAAAWQFKVQAHAAAQPGQVFQWHQGEGQAVPIQPIDAEQLLRGAEIAPPRRRRP